ncbi:hypothetical protein SALBM135S_05511 [Streptomyces alboniger]
MLGGDEQAHRAVGAAGVDEGGAERRRERGSGRRGVLGAPGVRHARVHHVPVLAPEERCHLPG